MVLKGCIHDLEICQVTLTQTPLGMISQPSCHFYNLIEQLEKPNSLILTFHGRKCIARMRKLILRRFQCIMGRHFFFSGPISSPHTSL